MVSEHGVKPRGQIVVGDEAVEVGGNRRRLYRVGPSGHRAVQIGQQLVAGQALHERHGGAEQVVDRVDGVGEMDDSGPVDAGRAGARWGVLHHHGGQLRHPFAGGKHGEGDEVDRLIEPAFAREITPALLVDQARDGVRESPQSRIVRRRSPLGFNVDAPARAQALQGVVDLGAQGHEN